MQTKKTILITGASKGIGKSIATFLAQKYNVVLWARNQQELQNLEDILKPYNTQILTQEVDIANELEVKNALEKLTLQSISLDVVVNNAGVGSFNAIENTSTEEWDNMLNINAKGSFLVTKYTLPFLKKSLQGIYIFIASDAGKRTFANGGAYCASKFAQIAFANVLRAEVRKDNIKVSVICSGLVDTYFNQSQQGTKPAYLQPDDIAKVVLDIIEAPENVVFDEIMLHPKNQEY
jgi:NADP-dependent 3-hydroxy acid dehydrogenase YdfG